MKATRQRAEMKTMMRSGMNCLLASVLLLSACSSGDDGASDSGGPLSGTGAQLGATGGAVAATGGVPGAGGITNVPPASGGVPIAGMGGEIQMPPQGMGGTPMGVGGDPMTSTGGVIEPPQGMGGDPMGMGGMTGMGGDPPVGGMGGEPPVGTGGMPQAPGSKEPVIPAVAGDCPQFRDSTISFMGLGGIQMVAGPKPAGPTAPMVFYWHGTGSTSGEFALMATAVRQGVVAEGGVLISFQGTTGGDLLSGTLIFGAGDFNIADQLVACAVRDHNVDPRQIFATGCSAGGLFSAAMAAQRSNYIAAAAPNSGGWVVPVQFQNDFTPGLMTMHGAPGRDVVVVDFSTTSATADQAFKARGGFVINCNHGGGHCGAAALSGDVWNFFKAHPYGVDPYPWTGGLPAGFNSSCQIQ